MFPHGSATARFLIFRSGAMTSYFAPIAYDLEKCIVIDESSAFSGLSNVVGGYPLLINGARIATSEALYQACRFPAHPTVQRYIIDEKDGIAAKARSHQY